jgi:DNA-binding transcriptional ArsR family regulator
METNAGLAAISALSHPARLAVFRHLVQRGPEGQVAGDIARTLDLPASTLSAHLAELTEARLLTASRQGRFIRYAADLQGIRALIAWLLQDCCGGSSELCAPVLDQIGCAC